jgi:hypothetical protein
VRSSLLNSRERSSGKKILAPLNSTRLLVPGIALSVVEFAIAGRAGFFSHENLLSKPTNWAPIGDHPAAAAAVEIFSWFLRELGRLPEGRR